MYSILFIFLLLISACTPPAPVIKEVRFPTQSRDTQGPYAVNAKVEGSVSDVQLIIAFVLTEQDQQDQQDQQSAINPNLLIVPMQIQGDRWFASFSGISDVVEYRLQIKAKGPGGESIYPSDQPQSFVVTPGTLDCLVDQDCLSYEICHREELICVPKNTNCNETDDCPIDQICSPISKKCVYQDDLCATDDDCSNGEACIDRICSSRCQPPCALGSKCVFVSADLSNDRLDDDVDSAFCVDENTPFCTSDFNCNFGQICDRLNGQCNNLACNDSEICMAQFGEGILCLGGFCQAPNDQSQISEIFGLYCAHCAQDSDCGSDLLACSNRGYCALRCNNDLDCQVGENFYINTFYCDPTSNSCVEAYPITQDFCESGFSCLSIDDCQNDSICLRNKCIQSNACTVDQECGSSEKCQYNRCVPMDYCTSFGSFIACDPQEECILNQCRPIKNDKQSCLKVCNTFQDCLDTEICLSDLSIDGNKHCYALCDPNLGLCPPNQYCENIPSANQPFACIPADYQCGITVTPICQNDAYEPNDFEPYFLDLDQSGGFLSLNAVICSDTADQDLFRINSSYPVKLEVFSDQFLIVQVKSADFQVQEGRVTPNVPFFYEGLINDLVILGSEVMSIDSVSYNVNLSQQIPMIECIDDSLEYNNDFDNASTFGNGAVLNLTACLNDDDYLRLSRRARGDGLVDFSNLSPNTTLYIELYDNGSFFQSFELVDQLSVPITNYRGSDWVFRVVNTDQFQGVNYLVTARFN